MPNETQTPNTQLLEAMRRTAEQLLEHLGRAQASGDRYGRNNAESEVREFARTLAHQATSLAPSDDRAVYQGG